METERLMIARFKGGPYDGLTLKVHGKFEDFRAMGLMLVEGVPRQNSHELVAGQYVAQEKIELCFRVFKWDGPEVEMVGYASRGADTLTFGEGFFERRTDGDRRAGHEMGRRSFRGDRRGHRDHAVGGRELRRVEQRRDPKNQKREDS